jgi:hypothetical protein
VTERAPDEVAAEVETLAIHDREAP